MQQFTELLDDNLIWCFIYDTIKYSFNELRARTKVRGRRRKFTSCDYVPLWYLLLTFYDCLLLFSIDSYLLIGHEMLSLSNAHRYIYLLHYMIHTLHNFQVFIFNGNVFRMTIPNGIEEMNGSTKHLNEIHRCPFQVRCVRQQPCKSRKYIWQNYGLYCSSISHLYMYLLWSKHLVFMIAVIFISDAQVE